MKYKYNHDKCKQNIPIIYFYLNHYYILCFFQSCTRVLSDYCVQLNNDESIQRLSIYDFTWMQTKAHKTLELP